MEIVVHIDPIAALRAGGAAAGRQIVTFDAGALAPEDRELLAQHTERERSGPYDTVITGRLVLRGGATAPTIEAVLDACRARVKEAAEKEAEEKARHEARVQELLAMPPEFWLRESGGRLYVWEPESPAVRSDARIVARIEEIKSTLPAIEEKRAEEKRAREAETKAFEARLKAAEEARDAAARQLARRYPGLTRAAAEGYPVLGAVRSELVDDVRRRIQAIVPAARFAELVHGAEERDAPTEQALELRDACVKVCETVQVPEVFGCWEVSRVVRVDVAPSGSEHWITGTVVELKDHHGKTVREFVATLEDPGSFDDE